MITAILLIGFGFIVIKGNKIVAIANLPKQEVLAFTTINNFEDSTIPPVDHYSDLISYQGKKSFKMCPPQTFSPDLHVDLGKINLDGIYEADASVMLYTTDPLSSGNLVFEIYDIPSGKRIVWQSSYLEQGKFTLGKWFQCVYTYPLSKAYLTPDYRIKTYLWTTGKGVYYADDLKLELKAKR